MAYVFRVVLQAGDMVVSSLVSIHFDFGDDLEHTQDCRWLKVVMDTGPGVYEYRSLLGFHQDA
jgi:hypothetical protein